MPKQRFATLRSPAAQFLGLSGLIALAIFYVLATPWAAAGFVQPFTRVLVDISAHLIAPLDSRVPVDGDGLRSSDGRSVV